jgi:hypothetical protein
MRALVFLFSYPISVIRVLKGFPSTLRSKDHRLSAFDFELYDFSFDL